VELPASDVWSWSSVLASAGAEDLAVRVREIEAEYEVQS
jgi:hypothetical protein